MNYKYKEQTYAETVYKYGFQSKYIPTEMYLLCLYYRDILHYNSKKIYDSLYEFCEIHFPEFDIEKYYAVLNRAISRSKNKANRLLEVDSIPIYLTEFRYIQSLDIDYNYKKVIFALLVQNRLNKISCEFKTGKPFSNNVFKGTKKQYLEVQRMAKTSLGFDINTDGIYFLNQNGYVKCIFGGLIELSFIGNIPLSDEIMFYISNFENAGWFFDYYNNQKGIKLCKTCGQPFRSNNNRQEYCKIHSSNYKPTIVKTVKCCDCGKLTKINVHNTKTIRCLNCQRKHNNEIKSEWKSKSAENQQKN